MPVVVWKCEQCQKTREGTLRPPQGWVELSYWNPTSQKFHRFSFCSYACCGKWCVNRYEEPRSEDND